MENHYDYIITGAGCAGSSLLMRMMRDSFFKDKKILIIDQSPKNTNDRTWCFWEKQAGIFESIVQHRWRKLDFFSKAFSATLDITPYQYKMIRGIDLYDHVKLESATHANIEWRYEKIKSIETTGQMATVETETATLTAGYVFNSVLFDKEIAASSTGKKHLLLQHFTGWLIQTEKPCFDPSAATFMDFRVNQNHGTTFIYLMPTSPTTALVEYTLFTEKPLPANEYEIALKDYIASYLQVDDYKILHKEAGIIPMTNKKFPLQKGKVVHMGVAGGQVKGSSGYAFQFIQKRTGEIVQQLVTGNLIFDKRSFAEKKFLLYDSVLLNVLANRKMPGAEIFARIFQKNSAKRVLQFLDNESSLADDLKIMQSMPSSIFLPAALKELFT